MDLKSIITSTQLLIQKKLDELIINNDEKLTKAIRYSLFCSGKRLRPLLVMETAKLFNDIYMDDLLIVACSIEMIHIFSLIHDDLPSMDNDDFRRGELTCHKKFNEYDALLAGDSLIPLCFETILTKTKTLTNEEKCEIIKIICSAIGYKGMCLGQSLDIEFERNKKSKTSNEAEKINILKTGYLFKSCIEIGCIIGKANKNDRELLVEYSINFGKAFQLADDLEDSEINTDEVQTVKNKIIKLVDNCISTLDKLKNKNITSIENLKSISKYCLKNI